MNKMHIAEQRDKLIDAVISGWHKIIACHPWVDGSEMDTETLEALCPRCRALYAQIDADCLESTKLALMITNQEW